MSAEENKQASKDGYEAFGRGDAAAAMEGLSDSIEWVVGGDSAVSKTYRGKEELGAFWGQLAEKGFSVDAKDFIAEGDKVVVLTTNTLGGESADSVAVFTYVDGEVIRFEGFGGDEVLERAFPK